MNIPADFKYTKDHEWIRAEGDIAFIGVTDYAQGELGDIVFIEIDTVGAVVEKEKPFGTIEAVKTVSDLFMPVTGKILEKNPKTDESPEIVNKDPYGDGWLVKIIMTDPGQLDALMDSGAYKLLIGA